MSIWRSTRMCLKKLAIGKDVVYLPLICFVKLHSAVAEKSTMSANMGKRPERQSLLTELSEKQTWTSGWVHTVEWPWLGRNCQVHITVLSRKEKGRDPTQSYDKSPYKRKSKYNDAKRSIPVHPKYLNDAHRDADLWPPKLMEFILSTWTWNLKGAGSSPRCANIFHSTMFACWHSHLYRWRPTIGMNEARRIK